MTGIVEQEDVSSSSENNSETEADEIDDIHIIGGQAMQRQRMTVLKMSLK